MKLIGHIQEVTKDVSKSISTRLAKSRDDSKKIKRKFDGDRENDPQKGLRKGVARLKQIRRDGRNQEKLRKWDDWMRKIADPEERLKRSREGKSRQKMPGQKNAKS